MEERESIGGERALVEREHWWRESIGGERALEEREHWWRESIGGERALVGRALVEREHWWRESIGGERALMEREHWWGESIGGERALVEREHWWRESIGGDCSIGEGPSDDGDHSVVQDTELVEGPVFMGVTVHMMGYCHLGTHLLATSLWLSASSLATTHCTANTK